MPSLLVILPLLAVLLLNLPLNFLRRLALPAAVLLAVYQALFAMQLLPACCCACPTHERWFINVLDPLTCVLLLAIAIVACASVFVLRATASDERHEFNSLNLVFLAVAGMNGLVMVRDLFSLYVFVEIASVASFILIAAQRDMGGLEGAFKYLVMSALATMLLLASIALLLAYSGSTSFMVVAEALHRHGSHGYLLTAIGLFLGGLLIKSGVMPFHGWLPDAYAAAPAAASTLIAGIVTKTTGVYALIRLVLDVFGSSVATTQLLLIFGAISVVAGALAALGQSDMKRMLAYSSISQVGYILMGLGVCGSANRFAAELGVAGAVFHLFNHAIFKTLLFVNAAAVEKQTGTRDMNQLGGLAQQMPVTGLTSLLAMFATAGVPPLSGFWSKLLIIAALWLAGFHVYALIGIGASLLTLAYFLSLQRRVFFGVVRAGCENVREAGWALTLPSLVLAAILVGVGIAVPWLIGSFLLPVKGF